MSVIRVHLESMNDNSPVREETLEIIGGGLKIIQAREGYRYSIDPFLLCDFVHMPKGAKVADLGSGSGVVPLILSFNDRVDSIVGFEVQKSLVERSRRSIDINHLQDRIRIVCADIRALPAEVQKQHFDVVVSNPPFYPVHAGRVSNREERSIARHEVAGGLTDFIKAADGLLKSGGRFFMVYLTTRLPELLVELSNNQMQPKRIRMIHSRVNSEAKMVMVEGRKHGRPGLKVDSPLIIYDGEGRQYSEQVLAIFDRLGVADQVREI